MKKRIPVRAVGFLAFQIFSLRIADGFGVLFLLFLLLLNT